MNPARETELAGDRRRAALLNTARDEFVREGFDRARVERVCREARVSTATFYRFFESKDELFAGVVEAMAAEVAQVSRIVDVGEGTVRERLTYFARQYGTYMGDPSIRSIYRLVMSERRRFGDVAVQFVAAYKARFGKVLIDALDEMIERGELRLDRASWGAGQLLGMIEHPVFFVPLVRGDELQAVRAVDQIADEAVETFLARYQPRH